MISDQDLRDAARAWEKTRLETLPKPENCDVKFSSDFERKIKKLIFRVDHPILFALSRILPAVLVAGSVTTGAVLLSPEPQTPAPAPEPPAVSDTARPTEPAAVEPAGPVVYRPTWLPEDCRPDRETLYETEGMIVYQTAGGDEAVFLYATEGDPAEGSDLTQGREVFVGDCPGVLRLGQSKGAINDLFWTDGTVSFWLSAPYDEDILLRIAESVEAQSAE